MNTHNETNEIRKIVQEEVGTSTAHHFGLMKEWMIDQFTLMNERADFRHESLGRKFDELREEFAHTKTIVDENSLDVIGIKKEQEVMKIDISKLKKTYA